MRAGDALHDAAAGEGRSSAEGSEVKIESIDPDVLPSINTFLSFALHVSLVDLLQPAPHDRMITVVLLATTVYTIVQYFGYHV